MAYIDKIRSWAPVHRFRDRLQASPFFSEKTRITWVPQPGDTTREFKMEVVLAEPLDL